MLCNNDLNRAGENNMRSNIKNIKELNHNEIAEVNGGFTLSTAGLILAGGWTFYAVFIKRSQIGAALEKIFVAVKPSLIKRCRNKLWDSLAGGIPLYVVGHFTEHTVKKALSSDDENEETNENENTNG